jgi:O-antigen/teichoic acid export membrane protein
MGIGAALGLLLGAPFIVDVMAGSDFAGSVAPLRVLGIAMLGSFVLATWGFALLSLHNHRAILRANVAAFVVNVCAVVTLASLDGARGAAIGASIGEITLACGYLIGLIAGDARFRPQTGRTVRAAACAVPAGATLALGLPSAPTLALGLVIYAGLLWPAGALPDELTEVVRARFRPGY